MAAETWDIRDLLPESPPPQLLTTAERPEGTRALAEELAAYHAHVAPFFTRSEQRAWAAAGTHNVGAARSAPCRYPPQE